MGDDMGRRGRSGTGHTIDIALVMATYDHRRGVITVDPRILTPLPNHSTSPPGTT
jgi:Na+-transporting NADH:ubiquinone oxidoreductase subunit NqrF